MRDSLFTTGYQGLDPPAFTVRLLAHEIDVVVDVRDVPQSRKRGFSKAELAQSLAEHGIEYLHLKELGNPKALRASLRRGLDFDEFASNFRKRLEGHPATLEALVALADLAMQRRICLLCYEEDPMTCHRSLVAEGAVRRRPDALEVVHL